MFNILLQINNSEKNKLDKSINTISELSGVLREETSIIDPIITIEGDISAYVNCNYMTIPVFNRSYFITNIRSIKSNLFEISAHVDVLSTYKAGIRSNEAIIRKQAHKWNLYLNDGSLEVYQNPHVITKTFPSGFNTQSFVMAIAGD